MNNHCLNYFYWMQEHLNPLKGGIKEDFHLVCFLPGEITVWQGRDAFVRRLD